MEPPDTQFAKTPDGAYIAYQVTGERPVDVAWQFDWLGNIDLVWEVPRFWDVLAGIASFARLILHDRRATGLSSANVPPPNLETRAADLRVVLDAVGSERPVLAGELEGGASSAFFAATHPDRTHSVVWTYPVARSVRSRDYPWGAPAEQLEIDERELEHWGTLEGARIWAEGEASHGHFMAEEDIRAYARLSRNTATPDIARQMARTWRETDVRSILPSVKVRTLLLTQGPPDGHVDEVEYIASLMPMAEIALLPQGPLFAADVASAEVDEIRRFVGIEPARHELDTVLATVLFTDIVGSTERQSALGDRAWKDLIRRHHAAVRSALQRWKGVEVSTAGDGFFATSTDRRVRSGVRSTLLETCASSGSRSARASTRASASWSTATCRGSRSRPAHGSPRWRAPPRS
ncbi:MAG TPA: adenylate/guanylate cyclase domain-containing protein [Actinomycetota bacterium]|nr:adenylate/guanylate cyclase domain-containing protein [Actinomycetota bacterium]